ncbi:MAG: copper-translocating P-type ATPase [Erysipelotrichales bacterium]|nr:copper-translocating P-type ATPase [Erysipelotrichales bacterium]
MKKIVLKISGMTCSACSSGLEKYLNKQTGIISASVNLVLEQALIEYKDDITIDDLNRFVKEAGFKSLGEFHENEENKRKVEKIELILFSILSIIILYISMSHMVRLPVIPFLNMMEYPINYAVCLFILTIPYLFYGFEIFKKGLTTLMHKNPNMDTLVSIGVIASFLYSTFGMIMILLGDSMYVESLYFESAAIVLYFIKLGRFIDSNAKEKTKDAIKDLVQITPTKALLKIKNGEKEVTLDEVKKGDILICKPGMKVAVDGIIVSGTSHFDESFITGESKPSKKGKDERIVAGSINYDGYIEYKATNIGKDSTISEIVRLVIEATNTKTPISKIADKVSGVFVPGIIIIAFLTFVMYLILGYDINDCLTHFVTVLVVACPCALGLATPLAIVVSEGMCAKNGILVKTSETLENAHKIDTVVFDKTGTLTCGTLQISKTLNYSQYDEKDLIRLVASLENDSTHPIRNAFISYVNENRIKLDKVISFKNLPGVGITGKIKNDEYYIGNNKIFNKLKINDDYKEDEEKLAREGNSIVYVVENKKVIALIGVKDIVREDSKRIISELKKINKHVIMLTGDNEITANTVADELGIDEVIANVMPKDKTNKIKDLISSGKKVMMVGDGINDAPSLAVSTIGVSVSSGTDIANNSADVILMNDNLFNLLNLIFISKKTIRNIKQNLFWAFFYNTCMIPIAIGLLSWLDINMNPMIAGFAMMLSSFTVILNALRLKRIKLRRD